MSGNRNNWALGRPVIASSGQESAQAACDGKKDTQWTGAQYPAYIDIDLRDNIILDRIRVSTPAKGYTYFTIYTSLDGRDFTRAGEWTTPESCPQGGYSFAVCAEARIIRVLVTYYSEGPQAVIQNVCATGQLAGTMLKTTEPIAIEPFEATPYNTPVTEDETIEEVYGIVERCIGKAYCDWFAFSLASNPYHPDFDYFVLEDRDGQVRITGNNGVSLATGLNHYLKYFCNVHISQTGDQLSMPDKPAQVGRPVRRECTLPVRYAYNYCTHGYTMAFWGEDEWRKELDWLALNGVNVVLDITAQEEVWRRFLLQSGYTHQEAKNFIAGPGYQPWMLMANLSGFGGPVHDSWFVRRTELARRNHRAMRRLGMYPVLQAYNGMIPNDIMQKDNRAKILTQGLWNSFDRPAVLKTTSYPYIEYANRFYACQREVYGDITPYFATDPFHEGGRRGMMPMSAAATRIIQTLLENRTDAVWIIQSWGDNPTLGMLKGLKSYKEHTLFLDLYAEKTPRWETWGGGEFGGSPWVYCMLNNFGGRMGIHGHISNFVREIPRAANTASCLRGIGITPEACRSNPILFDLFFETVWTSTPEHYQQIELGDWMRRYARRRYGADSENAVRALRILIDTAYNPLCCGKGEGAPESVVNARPNQDSASASTWGHTDIGYDKALFEDGVKMLLQDWDRLSASECYRYDVADVLKQMLSNTIGEIQRAMCAAYRIKKKDEFSRHAGHFLSCIDLIGQILGTQKEFLLGTWLMQAKELAKDTDDFMSDLLERNARMLVTTWGAIRQANGGQLKDYSNRQWAGLTQDFYLPRWALWIDAAKKELGGAPAKHYDWFPLEWDWVLRRNTYDSQPNALKLPELADEAFAHFTVSAV